MVECELGEMTSTRARDPPNWAANQSYEDWKNEIEIWRLLKSATAEEEGPLVYRVLTGSAKDTIKRLTPAQVGSATGLAQILAKLDAYYEVDKNQKICVILEAFEKFKRTPSMTMSTFLLEFEKLYAELIKSDCKYPDAVLAYKLLMAANLSAEHERLCKATVTTAQWTYDAMKIQIKKIFCDYSSDNLQVADRPIKVEPTLFTNRPRHSPQRDSSEEYDEEEELSDDDEYRRSKYNHEEVRRSNSQNQERDIYYGRNKNFNFNRRSPRNQFNSNPNYQRQQSNRPQYQNNPQGKRYININIDKLRNSYNGDPNVPNPKDERGKHTTCRKCHSIYHWLQDCPHANNNSEYTNTKSKVFYTSDPTDEVYISLFQSTSPSSIDEVQRLVGETHSQAVIDTGCPTPVCGDKWLYHYLEPMTNKEKENIKVEKSDALFRFGDSPAMRSTKKIYLPLSICDQEMYLPIDVVEADIPLLLSKDVLIRSKAKLDFGKETIQIYDIKQPMMCTTSGHYAIPIRPHNKEITTNIIMHAITDERELNAKAKKLHQTFGHPSAQRLIKLITDSGNADDKLLNAVTNITNSCDTCKRYKKTPPRPVVTFPLATTFNETVALDLKTYKNNAVYFLHMIDHATRFSAAGVIRSKTAELW